jgi:hypothetical protein
MVSFLFYHMRLKTRTPLAKWPPSPAPPRASSGLGCHARLSFGDRAQADDVQIHRAPYSPVDVIELLALATCAVAGFAPAVLLSN